jgi:hypothetical protein
MTSAYYSAKRWMQLGLRKGVVFPACRRFYRDTNHDLRRTLLIAGTGRSGTTWLAELLGTRLPCRIMFEPFNPRKVEPFSGYEYFQYMRPGEDDPRLLGFCEQVLTGRIRHPWIDRQVDRLRPEYRVIKEIRANLFLKWLADRFPTLPILFIVRHPCAVVASRLQLGWDTDADLVPLLRQPRLVEDFLADKLDLIHGCQTPAEKHAVIWSISNLVPLRQFGPGALPLVFYENLVQTPQTELPRVFHLCGLDYDEAALGRVSRLSATTVSSSAIVTGGDKLGRWKRELTPRQIDSVRAVVAAFGLDHLYGDEITANPIQDHDRLM